MLFRANNNWIERKQNWNEEIRLVAVLSSNDNAHVVI